MILTSSPDPTDGSSCTLVFEEQNNWLRAVWKGFVDNAEAVRGADIYLETSRKFPCPYLLNDNTRIEGPWFDSVEWLQRVWAPAAAQLGLRYVAHVTPDHRDELAAVQHDAFKGFFEVQFFKDLADAEDWLRSCQDGE